VTQTPGYQVESRPSSNGHSILSTMTASRNGGYAWRKNSNNKTRGIIAKVQNLEIPVINHIKKTVINLCGSFFEHKYLKIKPAQSNALGIAPCGLLDLSN
jgi:hypothetical protein